MKTTEENNKLIAEFIEVPKHEPDTRTGTYWEVNENDLYETSELKYHTSWDWLMRVVEHISYTGITGGILYDLNNALSIADIDGAYKAIVVFINWYNKRL